MFVKIRSWMAAIMNTIYLRETRLIRTVNCIEVSFSIRTTLCGRKQLIKSRCAFDNKASFYNFALTIGKCEKDLQSNDLMATDSSAVSGSIWSCVVALISSSIPHYN